MENTIQLQETAATLRHMWRHRKGINILGRKLDELTLPLIKKKVYLEHDIPGTIMDTIDALWPEGKPRPLLTHKSRVPCRWHMIFTLQPGVACRDVVNRQDYFADACRGNVEIRKVGGYVHMTVTADQLKNFYPYTWDPAPYSKMALPVPVGYSPSLEVMDLAEAPHLLVAGVTGFGKSNLLLVLIHSLLTQGARIGIIDLKRLQFSYLKNHCALAKNERDALQLIRALDREMERRIDILEAAGVEKVQEYQGGDLPYIVLVIDEVAEIGEPEIIHHIDRIVRLARATGISVVAATQRPSKKVNLFKEDVRDNFAARVCYLMADEISSRLVLGENHPEAAHLPEVKGRGIYKFGVATKEIQTMYLPVKQAKEMIKGQEVKVWDVSEPRAGLPPR